MGISNKFYAMAFAFLFVILLSSFVSALVPQDIPYSITENGNPFPAFSYYNVNQNGNKVFNWAASIKNNGPGNMHVVFMGFHDNKAGNEGTIDHNVGGVWSSGKTDYNQGESGTFYSGWDTRTETCGRVQIDGGFIDERYSEYHDTNYFAILIDYGVDCITPPEPCVAPTGLQPRGEVTISGDTGSVNLAWNPVPDAVRYDVRLDDGTNDRYDDPRFTTCPSSPHYYCENGITGTRITNVPVKAGRTYSFWVDPIFSPERAYCNGGASFSVKKAVQSNPPACGFSPQSGRMIVNFDRDSGLRADYGENEATKIINGVYIPAGNYDVGLHSWDDHFVKVQPDQTREQFFVKFLNSGNREVARSGSTDDIPDNAESVVQFVNYNLLISQNINSLVLRHSAWLSSNPNSLLPICIALDKITPLNQPPVISSCTPPSTVTVGSTATISYSVSDPDGDAFTVTVNWGDGTITSGGQSSATHIYYAPGTYTVTITATDSRGASTSSSCGTITVVPGTVNQPPTIASCSPSSSAVSPGGTVGINYRISDPEGDSFSVTVNWGDGITSTGSSSSASHVYSSTGIFTVTITATDSRGASTSRSCSSIVVVPFSINNPPVISSCNPPSTAVVGTTATIHYSVSDPDGDTFSITVNWGDGSSSSGGPFSAAHIYLATGTYFVTVTATDSRGASTSRSCGSITVTSGGGNNPPVISSCIPPSTVQVGTTATINYAISDPDGDSFTVSVNWGDGSTSNGGTSSASHIYSSTGTFSVTITATDSRGASTSRSCGTITVTPTGGNDPPTITSCSLASSSISPGGTATVNYAITDPNGDTYTALVNWGDSISSTGSSTTASHTYPNTGSFNILLTATDSRGAASSLSCGTLTVSSGGCGGGSQLKIVDAQAIVDGHTSHVNDGQTISRKAGPQSSVDFKIKTRNLFSTSCDLIIRDVVVKVTIEGIDDGEDLEDESSEFDLRPQSDKTITLKNFDLPLNVEDGDYNVIIEAEGVDENGITQRDELNAVLVVEKDKHDLRFTKLTVNKANINCNEGFSLNYQIINLGREDEEKSYVEITSDELGINSFQRDISIQSGTEGNTYSRIVPLKITNNVEDGAYPLTVNVYSDDGTLQDTKTVQLNVQNCGGIKQINQTITTGYSSSNISLYGTETIERTIQIPFIQLFFRGVSGGWFWILISTLILSIFFVLVAIILMAKGDDD